MLFPCSKVSEALTCMQENPCDIAFLDIRMRSMTGLELARKLKDIHPKINIIFVTGYDEYAGEAMRLHASGYIEKPVTEEKFSTNWMTYVIRSSCSIGQPYCA